MTILLHNYNLFKRHKFKRILNFNMLCQYFSANYTSCQLHEMHTQIVSQSNCRKAGPITNNTCCPGPIVISHQNDERELLIGPLYEIASLILIRTGRMLQGL